MTSALPKISASKYLGALGLLATAAGAVGIIALGSVGGTQAVTPSSVSQLQHYLDCFGVMITDPDVHAAECSPSKGAPQFETLSSPGTGEDCEFPSDDSFADADLGQDSLSDPNCFSDVVLPF